MIIHCKFHIYKRCMIYAVCASPVLGSFFLHLLLLAGYIWVIPCKHKLSNFKTEKIRKQTNKTKKEKKNCSWKKMKWENTLRSQPLFFSCQVGKWLRWPLCTLRCHHSLSGQAGCATAITSLTNSATHHCHNPTWEKIKSEFTWFISWWTAVLR